MEINGSKSREVKIKTLWSCSSLYPRDTKAIVSALELYGIFFPQTKGGCMLEIFQELIFNSERWPERYW